MLCFDFIRSKRFLIIVLGIMSSAMVFSQSYTYVKNDPSVSFIDILYNPNYNTNKVVMTPSVNGEWDIVLPFKFTFYCRQSDTLSVSEDGALILGRGFDVPSDNNGKGLISQQYMIAPWWDNWSRTGSAQILYTVAGTAPNRIFIVQWNNMQVAALTSGVNATFQVQIFETSNKIAFTYQSSALGEDVQYAYGKSGSIGLKGGCVGTKSANDVFIIDHSLPVTPETGGTLKDSLPNGIGNFVFTPVGSCTPTCTAPPSVTTTCKDIDKKVAAPLTYNLGAAKLSVDCGYTLQELAAVTNFASCYPVGKNTFTRTWIVKNDKNAEVSRCSQIVTVQNVSDFSVDFPDDIIVSCSEKIPAIATLKTQMLNFTNWDIADGAIKNEGCSNLTLEIVDKIDDKSTEPGVCQKVLRTIKVTDNCKFNPSVDTATSTWYGDPIKGDKHGYGGGSQASNDAVWNNLNQWRTDGETSRDRRFRDADGLTGPDNTGNTLHPKSFSDGVLAFTQVIRIIDKTAPVGTPQPDITVCTTTKCATNFTTSLKATDECSPTNSGVTFAWEIHRNKNTGVEPTLVQGAVPTITATLDTGNYLVYWTVKDRCGNASQTYSFNIFVRDCAVPTLSAVNKTVIMNAGSQTGQGFTNVFIGTIFNGVSDNCTDDAFLASRLAIEKESDRPSATTYPSPARTSVTLTCTDLKATTDSTARIRLWAVDRFGNAVSRTSIIKMQDIAGVCRPPVLANLTGQIKTEVGRNIEKVVVSTIGNSPTSANVLTDKSGNYVLQNLLIGGSYTIRASKTNPEDRYTGLSSIDIAIMTDHVLGDKKMTSPYALIAADTDGSDEIDAADILHMRNMILRKIDAFPIGIWRFVDSAYVFKNPLNPFTEDFPESITIKIKEGRNTASFIAIKIGDVNQSTNPGAEATMPNSVGERIWVEDVAVKSGESYSVDFTVDNQALMAFQGTLNTADLEIKTLEIGDFDETNFGVFKNAVTLSWNSDPSVVRGEKRFTIHFKANETGYLSEFLSLNNMLTPTMAFDKQGNKIDFNLKFKNKNTSDNAFVLYQNEPNPTTGQTTIGFHLPTESAVQLSIFDSNGRPVKVLNKKYPTGYNAVNLDINELGKGVYYYRIDTPQFNAVKKLVLVD